MISLQQYQMIADLFAQEYWDTNWRCLVAVNGSSFETRQIIAGSKISKSTV